MPNGVSSNGNYTALSIAFIYDIIIYRNKAKRHVGIIAPIDIILIAKVGPLIQTIKSSSLIRIYKPIQGSSQAVCTIINSPQCIKKLFLGYVRDHFCYRTNQSFGDKERTLTPNDAYRIVIIDITGYLIPNIAKPIVAPGKNEFTPSAALFN